MPLIKENYDANTKPKAAVSVKAPMIGAAKGLVNKVAESAFDKDPKMSIPEDEMDRGPTLPATPAETTPRDPRQVDPTPQPASTPPLATAETVEDRMNALNEKGSKYTELNRNDAIRQANSRGLINSTMAGAAGVEAGIRASLPIAQQDAQATNRFRENEQNNYLNITRDNNSASLNEHLATLESSLRENEMTLDSQLKTQFEKDIQDERFSDEIKVQMVAQMNNIIRDAQEQTVQVGLSDSSAKQQAAAIRLIQANRDAEIAVYQDLLESFDDWEWGLDFTPGAGVTTADQDAIAASTAPPPPPPPRNTRTTNDDIRG